MVKVLFVDRHIQEVAPLWQAAINDDGFQLLPSEPFHSVAATLRLIDQHRPDVVVIDYHLNGRVKGSDLLRALEERSHRPYTVANSRGGLKLWEQDEVDPDFSVDRDPARLRQVLYVINSMIGPSAMLMMQPALA